MLEEEFKEVVDRQQSAKNLKFALLALGYAVLSSVASFVAIDSAGVRSGSWFRVLVAVYYLLMIVSATYAFLACKNSIKSLQTDKRSRNYIALILGGLLLLGICRQILGLI